MWEKKETYKERYTKSRIKQSISLMMWGYRNLNNHYRFLIFFNAIMSIIPTYLGLYNTTVLKEVINSAVSKDTISFRRNISIYLFIVIFSFLLNAIYGYFISKERSSMLMYMRKKFYNIIFKKEYGSIERIRIGFILQRLQGDIPNICNLLFSIPANYLSLFVQIIGSAYLIFKNVPEAGLLAIPLTIIFSIATYLISKRTQKISKEAWDKSSITSSLFVEHLSNIMIFHTFGKEDVSIKQVSDAMDEQRKLELKSLKLSTIFSNGSNIMMIGISLLSMYYFLNKVISSSMNIGTYSMLVSLVDRLKQQARSIASIVPVLYDLLMSSERINEIDELANDLTSDPISEEDALDFYNNKLDSFGLKDVSFAYPNAPDTTVLENFNLNVEKGKFVAITGESGCGKSTTQKLMLGLYKPDKGSIYLKCKDGNEIPLDSSWRSLFSYVPQKNMLFFGTIREAVSFGELNDDNDDKYWEALRIACAEDFVKKLPDQLDSELGPNGIGLSEGQTQRIAIARAIYTNRPILLLDECTSSLDGQTEKKLLENIKSMSNKTVIIVTHRPAALSYCDEEIKFKGIN